jgi:HAD superfamily hydrolase (TIGR01509 family)
VNLEAVVFDFDGLIIDSEWVIFETAVAAFAANGHELRLEAWATIVGTNDQHDPTWWDRLSTANGTSFDRALYDAAYEAQDRSSRDHLPTLAGVVELVDALHGAGVPLGIASSSSRGWLDRHLGRLGLDTKFDAIIGADLVGGVGKPNPDVYLRACADLGADPHRAVALEDSAHGVTAAKAAGMAAVAVPSRITRHNDFAHADLVVDSLLDLDVATLRDLLDLTGAGDDSLP